MHHPATRGREESETLLPIAAIKQIGAKLGAALWLGRRWGLASPVSRSGSELVCRDACIPQRPAMIRDKIRYHR